MSNIFLLLFLILFIIILILIKNKNNFAIPRNIGFCENQLGFRGTSVSTFDYAYFNEKILGNKSYIFYDEFNKVNHNDIIDKYKRHFQVYGLNLKKQFQEIDKYIQKLDIDTLYIIRAGKVLPLSKIARNCVHCVFNTYSPHGDVYASITPWTRGNNGKYPVVPHMINLPNHSLDMREELNIPQNATVFGGYGGEGNFDIQIAHRAVEKVAKANPNIYFLFAGFKNKFADNLPNVIRIYEPIINLDEKVAFINTCDAMLWARSGGEEMSLAMGEFSSKNKPIIATKLVKWGKGHVHLLGKKGIWYTDENSLINILQTFDKNKAKKKDWNAYKDYTPEKVMKIFNDVFLQI